MTVLPRVSPALALTVFLSSLGGAAWSFRRALLTDPLPSAGAVTLGANAATPDIRVPVTATKLAAAIGKDPFHPERRRPAQRFRLPGEAAPGADVVSSEPFKLIGTAAMAEGKGFAMCQLGAEPPKLVRIGESIGGLTLKSVQPGRASFVRSDGKRYEARVPKAGS
jgi:hypothetical protein